MSFFKSLILAIIATLLLTYVLGASFLQWFDAHLYLDDHHVEPFYAISVSALVAVVLVLIALAIVLSVFGSVIFIGLLIACSIATALLGIFWPVLVMALIIYWLFKDEKARTYSD